MELTADILDLIRNALAEDLGDAGDITSQSTIPETTNTTAVMRARENGIAAGVDVAKAVFKQVDPSLEIKALKNDGDTLSKGDDLLRISGKARSILKAERVALNFISHLSGIASETAKYVEAVKGTNAKILDTRKTLPCYRTLHKHAVKMGGGTNHRFGLYDMVLIKDNHIAAAGGVIPALDAVKENKLNVKIEIEVDTPEQLKNVIEHGGADIVMLDNMPPDLLKQAVELVDHKMLTEASGGVNLQTVREIAQSGVDYISIGALTHSVKALDIGLDID